MTTKTDKIQERAAFEAWHKAEMWAGDYDPDVDDPNAYEIGNSGFYCDLDTQRAWRGWQARAAVEADRTRRAAPSDTDIEALAKKHIAPHADRLREIVPEAPPYRDSEQFRRVKALVVDVLARYGGSALGAEPVAPRSRQDISDRFGFLEGLVSEHTYNQIVEAAVRIYEEGCAAPVAAQPEHPAVAQEPVGKVRHFQYSGVARNGFSQEAVLSNDAPTLPDGTLLYAAPVAAQALVTEEMVNRFLGWKLPEDFVPDCGVSFTRLLYPNNEPTGTNLFHAGQARAMLEYVLQGAPVAAQAHPVPESVVRVLNRLWEHVQGMEHLPGWEDVDQARRDLGIVPSCPTGAQK